MPATYTAPTGFGSVATTPTVIVTRTQYIAIQNNATAGIVDTNPYLREQWFDATTQALTLERWFNQETGLQLTTAQVAAIDIQNDLDPGGVTTSTTQLSTRDYVVVPNGGSNGNARYSVVRELRDESSAVAVPVWIDPDTDAVLAGAPSRIDLAETYPETLLIEYAVNGAPTTLLDGYAIRLPFNGGFEVYSDFALTTLIAQDAAATVVAPGATATEVIPETIKLRGSGTVPSSSAIGQLMIELARPGDGVAAVDVATNTGPGLTGYYRPAESGAAAFLLSSNSADENSIPAGTTWALIQFQAPPSELTEGDSAYLRDMVGFTYDGSDPTFDTTGGVKGFTLNHLAVTKVPLADLPKIKAVSNASATDGRAFAFINFYSGEAPDSVDIQTGPSSGQTASNQTIEKTTDWVVVPFAGSNGNNRYSVVREIVDQSSGNSSASVWVNPDTDATLANNPNRGDLAEAYPDALLVSYAVNGAPTTPINGFAIQLPGGGFDVFSAFGLPSLVTQDATATVAAPGATATEVIPETIKPRVAITEYASGEASGVVVGATDAELIAVDLDGNTDNLSIEVSNTSANPFTAFSLQGRAGTSTRWDAFASASSDFPRGSDDGFVRGVFGDSDDPVTLPGGNSLKIYLDGISAFSGIRLIAQSALGTTANVTIGGGK